MDYIECNHCQKKYIINLEKIPKVSKKWRCVSCQKVQLYPYYSEQEHLSLKKESLPTNNQNLCVYFFATYEHSHHHHCKRLGRKEFDFKSIYFPS